ncbi:ATP-dependent DNA helicase sgs1 [Puccinia graminis f. sp. tritici]|uniref:ATP-dependent DNA helicase sgs1 n=1 Tax=Puccinia graminis f. sp. tritici TaxID=56615 RepID=A0A5B0S1N1_PUCGR|nr:ATP-dependent DNA helicase sgs1 [Puccinia graminis f. sp. tritici]
MMISRDRIGYIPLSVDDPAYIREALREKAAGMTPCRCSNCSTEAAPTLINNLVWANKDNFDSIIADQFVTAESRDLTLKYPTRPTPFRKRKIPDSDRPEIDAFKAELITNLHRYFNETFGGGLPLPAAEVFGDEEAEAIVTYMHHINTPNDIRGIIGGKCYDGQLVWLFDQVITYKNSLAGKMRSAPPKKAKANPPGPGTDPTDVTALASTSAHQLLPRGGARPPTKKSLAAEASRRKSLEKKAQEELWLISEHKRKEQIAQFLREGLEQARLERLGEAQPTAGRDDGMEK